ncbi:hypothetical protein BCR32DRAFT_291002 [Anaeromyces robustus]|uniref:C2 domain-containing protein n=1 Tax=Anaeromyces robustus TaxID=1754192 RepID=A0A1Y1XHU3_9FUNG|nr:hypothetical protein BCR32DRAFT_291002 [Anaeromyces robustus]|eukprot:ORX84944.1 hypothetical protein BCR32DRAFT_291002 [Anaeromyces robustus]
MTIELCHIHEELPQSLIVTPRIKQLKSILGRQIEKSAEVKDLFGIYYTLITNNGEEKEFYKSNIIKNSLNPTWNPLDRLMFPSWINEQSSDFIIKVWFISGNDYNNPILLFTNKIEGKLLVYIGTELTVLKSEFSKNSLIFEYTNGYYIQCSECSELRKESINTINVYKVDNSQVKKSYSADMLINLNKIQEEIKKEKEELEKKKNAIREKLKSYRENHYLDFKKVEHKEESTIVENQLVISMLNIEETTQRIEEFRNSNVTKRAELNKKLEDYNSQMEELENEKKEFEHEMIQKNNHIKFMRYQRLAELIHDLLNIYPIEPSISDPLIYTIGGIPLPNSRYEGYNLDDISTALGYSCHLITVIADYLDVVLRYPIKSMSSRSIIVDPLSKECQPLNEFPLFAKKLNDNRFIYGVFLLNKDIEQLLNYIKQNVSNLRNTLPNLRKLLYKIVQLGSSDSNFANESFSESANLNNKCFQHVIQSFDNDSQYYYASSIGSSSNYYSSSTYNPNYPYLSNTPLNSNISSSNLGNTSFINSSSSNNNNNNNNNNNSNNNSNNNINILSPILSYSNTSFTGINITSTSLYSQPSILNNSIYSNSLQSQQTLSEINVSSTILSRSYINKKNYNNYNK